MANEKHATGAASKKRAAKPKTNTNGPVAAANEASTSAARTNLTAINEPTKSDRPNTFATPTAEEVRRRAYELWEQRGREHGMAEDDWYRAENEVRGKSAHQVRGKSA